MPVSVSRQSQFFWHLPDPSPGVCPHPARGPDLASGTRGLKPPPLSLPLSAQMALAPFCPHEYNSLFRALHSSPQGHCPLPVRFYPRCYFSETQSWKGLNSHVGPFGWFLPGAERSRGSGYDHLHLTDEGAEAFGGSYPSPKVTPQVEGEDSSLCPYPPDTSPHSPSQHCP